MSIHLSGGVDCDFADGAMQMLFGLFGVFLCRCVPRRVVLLSDWLAGGTGGFQQTVRSLEVRRGDRQVRRWHLRYRCQDHRTRFSIIHPHDRIWVTGSSWRERKWVSHTSITQNYRSVSEYLSLSVRVYIKGIVTLILSLYDLQSTSAFCGRQTARWQISTKILNKTIIKVE